MSNGQNNKKLTKSRIIDNDEFYTLYSDIEKEMNDYIDYFNGKIVLCNCNDANSNFYKFFHQNFKKFNIKELICVNFLIGGGSRLFGYKSYYKSYKGGNDLDLDYFDMVEIYGNGSFDSKECLKLLDYCDIVVTNPPYSKFIRFIDILFRRNKKFILLGNILSVKYKIMLEKFINNCVVYENRVDIFDGGRSSSCWIQNVNLNRCVPLELVHCDDFSKYIRYNNYDAINVDNVNDIPDNYFGKIGVPISYFMKHPNNYFYIVDYIQHPFVNGVEIFARFIIKRKDKINYD